MMKQRYLNEISSSIIGYFSTESIGNCGEDYLNVYDLLEIKLGHMFDLLEETVCEEEDE